jgi:hypothetical protein
MRKANIEVDIVGQINLFRTATFPSKYPIIKEAIQNGQRSKGVTKMEFWVKPEQLVIMDNGEGLTDPRSLLTIAKSGWDEETKKEQNPFGLGFFSCVKTADLITVESNKLKLTLDIPKIMSGDTSIDLEDLDEPVKGFRITLSKPIKPFQTYEISGVIREVARYITKFETEINGVKVDSRDYRDPDTSKFARRVSNSTFKGWMRPYTWSEYNNEFTSDGLKIFYQDRLVRKLSSLDIAGCIDVYNGKVNLRAPDREDFIRDDKLDALDKLVESEFRVVLIDILNRASDKELKRYSEIIEKRMKPHEYANYLKYTIVNDYAAFHNLLDNYTEEELKELSGDEIVELLEVQQEETKPQIPSVQNLIIAGGAEQVIDPTDREESGRTGSELPKMGSHPMMYSIDKDEMVHYVDILKKAVKHSIPIIIIRNGLEKEAIRLREDIIHVSELKQVTHLKAKLSNIGAIDLKEKRAMMLFRLVAKVLGLESNPFVIGDLEATEDIRFGPVELDSKPIDAFAVANMERIMIDRSKLHKGNLSETSMKRILPSDLQFIATNLDTIAHELAHHMYGTDDETGTHYKLQLEITETILRKLFSPDFNF